MATLAKWRAEAQEERRRESSEVSGERYARSLLGSITAGLPSMFVVALLKRPLLDELIEMSATRKAGEHNLTVLSELDRFYSNPESPDTHVAPSSMSEVHFV